MTIISLDSKTETLARQLAELSGAPVEAVIRAAIERAAADAGVTGAADTELTEEELIARIDEITEHAARLPVLDNRTPDEIIGYDDHGLPK